MPFLTTLIVEDHKAFRRFIRLALQQAVEFQVIAEASDGVEAVQKAKDLRPDLILLDIGLPKLDGLEAGRRIREVSPNSKILFLSQESSPDVVREALKLGALGYVTKSRAQSDLLPAMKAILRGEQFVSSGIELSENIKVADITELDEIRLRYAAIVDSSDDAIIAKDLQGVISAWNPAAQRMFGYTQEEALGQPITMLVPPELHAKVRDILQRLRAGERIQHFETRRISKAGKTVDISLTISPIKNADGRVIGASTIARDITESKRVLAALHESEERFRLAQQAGRIGTFEWNIQTGVDTWTPELEAMYGLSPGSFGRTRGAFEALVHPDDRAEVNELVRAAMKTGQPANGEWRTIWSDGSVHWIVGRWQVFKNESGEPSRMIGVNIEVTERKVAEQALRVSEERFRLAAQAGRMYAFDWDVTSDVILRSEEATRLPGLVGEPTNLTKQQLLARIHPEDRATFSSSIAELTPERPDTQISFRLLRPDGSVVWLERTGHAFFDEHGKMVRMIGMVADITERRRSEEPLRRSESYLSQAERLAHSGSWAWDARTRETFWSQEMFRILDYDPKKTRPSLSDFLARVHPEDRLQAEQRVREEASGLDVVSDYRIVLPDGAIRHLQAIGHPIKNESGEVVEVVGTTVDITERKLAEEALSRVGGRLIEAHEEERTRIARELHDDVGQRLVLLAWQLGSSNGNLRKQIEDLANDVQALSHQLHSPKLDYLGLAAAAAGFCKELSDRQRVEIEFHSENIRKELPKDISLCLFRVLQEALQNAIKHSGSRQFQVSLRRGTNEIELTVRDSGIGFETDEAIKGPGLGLTNMQERLKLVNGRLSIDSKPQRGTTIHARVPFRLGMKSAGATG